MGRQEGAPDLGLAKNPTRLSSTCTVKQLGQPLLITSGHGTAYYACILLYLPHHPLPFFPPAPSSSLSPRRDECECEQHITPPLLTLLPLLLLAFSLAALYITPLSHPAVASLAAHQRNVATLPNCRAL